MLHCPFCQVDNSDDSLHCQHCGEPLQRWYGVLWPKANAALPSLGDYLDADHRYRGLEHPTRSETSAVITQRLLDCQPHADSPLHNLQTLWLDQPDLDPSTHPEIDTVPAIAHPYLALQADYFPAIPEIQDVQTNDQYTLVVLEDRSTWPRLVSLWPRHTLDPLQQTQWLFEITLLWPALVPWQGQSTLLNPDRLVLSPNSLVCLDWIELDPSAPPTLQDLGQSWQRYLLAEVGALAPDLKQVINALAEGTLATLDELQEALATLAGQYRSISTSRSEGVTSPDLAAVQSPSAIPLISDEDLMQMAEDRDYMADADTEEGSSSLDLPTMVLPMKLLTLDEASQSHVGQQRNHNEDWFFSQTRLLKTNDPHGSSLQTQGLYILCDGMGGHASGEVASQLAVDTLRDYFSRHWADTLPDQDTLTDAVFHANEVIFSANQAKASSGIGRMGTTLVMLLIQNLQAAVVHVGDSRLYSYNKRSGLAQITSDHEVGQREINRGVEPAIAYARPDAYQLTQALGPRNHDHLKPGITYCDIAEDTLFILCSDGLSDNDLLERHEATHIAPLLSARVDLDQGVAGLIRLANEKNGHDNISIIVVRLKLRPDLDQLAR